MAARRQYSTVGTHSMATQVMCLDSHETMKVLRHSLPVGSNCSHLEQHTGYSNEWPCCVKMLGQLGNGCCQAANGKRPYVDSYKPPASAGGT